MGTRRGRASALVTAVSMFVLGILMFPATATLAEVTEWPAPGAAHGIAAGPDGNLWFVTRGAQNTVGRITPAGEMRYWVIDTAPVGAFGIAAGPDGAMWFTERAAEKIGRVDMSGRITNEFTFPNDGRSRNPRGIALGPDGAMWFTEPTADAIGRIDMRGNITEFGGLTPGSHPFAIATGPDGALWFTSPDTDLVGRMTTSGDLREYPVGGSRSPMGIVVAPDGGVWFSNWMSSTIARLDPSTGDIAEAPLPAAGAPVGIAIGRDDAIWFAEEWGNQVGRVDPVDLTVEEFAVESGSQPYWITSGPDGNLWFTGSNFNTSTIGRVRPLFDEIAPTISIRSPVDGAAFLVNQSVTAEYRCDDEGSGVRSCDGPVPSGQPLDTSTAGVKTFEVVAVDVAGNRSVVSVSYVVFSSWESKLALSPTVTTVSAGTPVHLVFGLGGDRGMNIFEDGYPVVRQVPCGNDAATMHEPVPAEDWPDLRYSGGKYRYSWRTDRSWAGTCQELVLRFTVDGGGWTSLFVRFQ